MSTQEVFILTITRNDGSPFVTSVGARDDIRPAAGRHGAARTTVSHWRRDGEGDFVPDVGRVQSWQMAERYAL